MAVAQHQFYLDRKQSKANALKFKSLNDCINELNILPAATIDSNSTSINSKTNPRKFAYCSQPSLSVVDNGNP
jgi:hypothetical protein